MCNNLIENLIKFTQIWKKMFKMSLMVYLNTSLDTCEKNNNEYIILFILVYAVVASKNLISHFF